MVWYPGLPNVALSREPGQFSISIEVAGSNNLVRQSLMAKANGGKGDMYIKTAIFVPNREEQRQFNTHLVPKPNNQHNHIYSFVMKPILLLTLLPLAATAPSDPLLVRGLTRKADVPQKVQILGVSLLGSGCPAGTADVQIDATKTLMEVTFSEYIVQTGPGTRASDWRKNCKLTLNLAFDEGFQYDAYPYPKYHLRIKL